MEQACASAMHGVQIVTDLLFQSIERGCNCNYQAALISFSRALAGRIDVNHFANAELMRIAREFGYLDEAQIVEILKGSDRNMVPRFCLNCWAKANGPVADPTLPGEDKGDDDEMDQLLREIDEAACTYALPDQRSRSSGLSLWQSLVGRFMQGYLSGIGWARFL